jgi:hypothetical protein
VSKVKKTEIDFLSIRLSEFSLLRVSAIINNLKNRKAKLKRKVNLIYQDNVQQQKARR